MGETNSRKLISFWASMNHDAPCRPFFFSFDKSVERRISRIDALKGEVERVGRGGEAFRFEILFCLIVHLNFWSAVSAVLST